MFFYVNKLNNHFDLITKGLCGTFNSNQNDDFLTPENDVEQSVIPFANKWKTNEKCIDIKKSDHPCEKNIQNKPQAEKYCSKLTGKLFEGINILYHYKYLCTSKLFLYRMSLGC